MKILALIDLVPGADVQKVRASLPEELRTSWALFSAGTIREAYTTSQPTRVVFVLEAASVYEARARLGMLPLVGAGLLRCELVELRPFTSWSMLFA